MKFLVGIREVSISTRLVEAENEEDAKKIAGDAPEIMCEYSHSLGEDTWSVERVKPEQLGSRTSLFR